MVFGIVVEAERDALVYSALIRRLRPGADIVTRPCGDLASLRRSFVPWLKNFQWHVDLAVDKALVIRDSDCKDPLGVEMELARILDQSDFQDKLTLPVHFYATKCMVETWLLADEGAVNTVARRRGKAANVLAVADPLEGKRNAKELFRGMLSQAKLPATSAVYEEVAREADIGVIERRCPYFAQFVDRLNNC